MELDADKRDDSAAPHQAEPELPRWRWGAAIQLLAAAGFVLLAAFYFLPTPSLTDSLEIVRDWGLVPFYLAFIVLALLGIPSTPFFLLGGAAFPVTHNLIAITIALVIHFALAWLIAAKWMRGPIKRFLLRRGMNLPEVGPDNQWRIALLVKFAPGVPLFIKSYLLGVTGVAFVPFMIVSTSSTLIFASAFVTMGRSAIEGQFGLLLGGVAFLIFSMALFRVIREHLRAKKADRDLFVD
jgi:uncharacterized membrane protein YdjX (TVP38/TMEM64 family)